MRQREQAAALLEMAAQDLYLADAHACDAGLGDELWGFHAQQAAEKLLKAMLSAKAVQYPLTHRLVRLADLARGAGIAIPERLDALWDLTPYAAESRYMPLPPSPDGSPLDRAAVLKMLGQLRELVERTASCPQAMSGNQEKRMIKLGVNSVLFGGFDFATAAKHIALAGYDGVEISAIKGMCEHLNLDQWQAQAKELKQIAADNKLEFLSMEEAALDEERLLKAFAAGAEIGIPVVNIGPGGKSNVEEDFVRQTDLIAKMAEKAQPFGVTLCVKAHVGASIFNTPSTLRVLEKIKAPAFGIDMDPSHIYRANEDPAQALRPVLSRTRHIHIRDCLGRGPTPGTPQNQACGRGDIDLHAYCKVMAEGGYSGPVCLEVIGAGKLSLAEVSIIAAESYGYLNACLRQLGARKK